MSFDVGACSLQVFSVFLMLEVCFCSKIGRSLNSGSLMIVSHVCKNNK